MAAADGNPQPAQAPPPPTRHRLTTRAASARRGRDAAPPDPVRATSTRDGAYPAGLTHLSATPPRGASVTPPPLQALVLDDEKARSSRPLAPTREAVPGASPSSSGALAAPARGSGIVRPCTPTRPTALPRCCPPIGRLADAKSVRPRPAIAVPYSAVELVTGERSDVQPIRLLTSGTDIAAPYFRFRLGRA